MAFDYSKLRGKIIEKFSTQADFAKAMKWSERTLSLKLNGKVPWKQVDIVNAACLLQLNDTDIPDYFFRPKVQNIELLKAGD